MCSYVQISTSTDSAHREVAFRGILKLRVKSTPLLKMVEIVPLEAQPAQPTLGGEGKCLSSRDGT